MSNCSENRTARRSERACIPGYFSYLDTRDYTTTVWPIIALSSYEIYLYKYSGYLRHNRNLERYPIISCNYCKALTYTID